MNCPQCQTEMSIGLPQTAEDAFQYECPNCKHTVGEKRDPALFNPEVSIMLGLEQSDRERYARAAKLHAKASNDVAATMESGNDALLAVALELFATTLYALSELHRIVEKAVKQIPLPQKSDVLH